MRVGKIVVSLESESECCRKKAMVKGNLYLLGYLGLRARSSECVTDKIVKRSSDITLRGPI